MPDWFEHLHSDNIGDLITLTCLCVMFWLMVWLEIKRTWRWERLGVALTIVTVCLAFSYTLTALDIVLTAHLWIPWTKWPTRAALFASGVFAIIVMRFDNEDGDESDVTRARAEGVQAGQELAAHEAGIPVVSAPVMVVPAKEQEGEQP